MPRFEKRISSIAPRVSLRTAAAFIVSDRLKAVRYYLNRLVKGRRPEVETVHQLRVWARRSIAVVDLFESIGPHKLWKKLRKRLRKIRRAVAAVRDWDVLCDRVAKTKPAADRGLLQRLRQFRQRARTELAQRVRRDDHLFSSKKLLRLEKELLASLTKVKGRSYQAFVNPRLAVLAELFRLHGEDDLWQPDLLHEFRISGKELRYALEITASSLPAERVEKMYDELTRLQERLGAVCDHRAAVEQFESVLPQIRGRNQRQSVQLAIDAEQAALRARTKEFLEEWNPDARRTWVVKFGKIVASRKPR